jgi:hypothetical protein
MPTYNNIDGDSGVVRYECGVDWIEVEFRNGRERIYTYTSASVGSQHIEQMKKLAATGDGLNAYIIKNVAKLYASKK